MLILSPTFVYGITWFLVFLICVVPFATVGVRFISQPGIFTLLWEPGVLKSLLITLEVGFTSLLFTLLVGIPVSYLIARAQLRGKSFLTVCLSFPFFVPSYLFAIAWVVLALPKVGILNRLGGFDWLNIYSFWGLIWVTCNAYFPLIVNTLSKSFESMDPSLEEAARVSGASPIRVFFTISLPCQLSNIIGSSLVFLFITLSSFGIPAIIGNPAKIYVLTTQVFTFSKMGGIHGADQAFVISLWLISFSLLLTTVGRALKAKHSVALTVGKASRPSLVTLGNWQSFCELFLVLLISVLVLLPLSALLLSSFFSTAGDLSWANLSLQHYRYLFKLPETRTAFVNSLSLAFLGGLTCCGLGLTISYFSHRTFVSGRGAIEKISSLPFSIPGTVVALAFIVSFGTGWGFKELSLLGSPFLLFLAYSAKDLAISVQTLGPALNQIDRNLDEAGRVCGAGSLGVVDRILFPLLLPALRSTFFLCALPMLSELTMSVLLFGPGTETLGTLIFQLQDYASPLAACALASLLVGVLATGLFIGRFILRDKI